LGVPFFQGGSLVSESPSNLDWLKVESTLAPVKKLWSPPSVLVPLALVADTVNV